MEEDSRSGSQGERFGDGDEGVEEIRRPRRRLRGFRVLGGGGEWLQIGLDNDIGSDAVGGGGVTTTGEGGGVGEGKEVGRRGQWRHCQRKTKLECKKLK